MQGHTKERWIELCDLATKEQDVRKFSVLLDEIVRLLTEKRKRLELEQKPTNIPNQTSD
jgi:hypothetical protein